MIEIMKQMNQINYGFVDSDNNIYLDNNENWDNEFGKLYRLQSPKKLLETKCGVCWDQVELERYLFNKKNIKVSTYFIISNDNKIYPTHTFLICKLSNKYYYFEHSWQPYRGIKEYNSELEIVRYVRDNFIKMLKKENIKVNIEIYKYEMPQYEIDANTFINHCTNGEKINI